MKLLRNLFFLKLTTVILSSIILIASTYILVSQPFHLFETHLFKIVSVLFVINLMLFIIYNRQLHKLRKQSITKDPKPHSKA